MARVTRGVAGKDMNQLTTALRVWMIGGEADSNYPLSYLYDLRASRPCRLVTAAVGQGYAVDRTLNTNGLFTSWLLGIPVGFLTSSPATATREDGANAINNGTCVKLIQGATLSWIYHWRTGGDVYIPEVMTKSPGGSVVVALRVQILELGLFWTGSVWTTTPTNCASSAGATYSARTSAVVMPSFKACGLPIVSVKVTAFPTTASATAVYVGSFNAWPRHTWTSLHGHALDMGVGLEVRKSTDAFASSDVLVDTLTSRPAGYDTGMHHATPNDYRYSMLKLVGMANYSDVPSICELLMAQDRVLEQGVLLPTGWNARHRQSISEDTVFSMTDKPAKDPDLAFLCKGQSGFDELEYEIRGRMVGGLYPAVIQLDETSRPDLLFWGRGEPGWSWKATTHCIFPTGMSLRGETPPLLVG